MIWKLTSYFDVTKASSHPLGKKPMSRDPGGLSVAMSWWTYIGQDYKSEGVNLLSGLLQWLSDKESACQCRKHGFSPWVRKIPWRRKWQPTPVFLPGEAQGQSLAGCSSRGHKRAGHDSATKQQQHPTRENRSHQELPFSHATLLKLPTIPAILRKERVELLCLDSS